MKTFQSLQEERGEKAFKQAIAMGLQYSGFGYWKDPATGETKYKTENDTLVPVEQDQSAEKFGGSPQDGRDSEQRTNAIGGIQGTGNMRGPGGMLNMIGGQQMTPGQNVGPAPEPGEEQVEKDPGWNAGPEGDTCIGPGADRPGIVPDDSFVGRTNFLKWRAGPQGDNMNTVSYERIQEAGQSFENFIAEAPSRAAAEAEKQGLELVSFGR
mgnify:CR=1 FL=1